MAYTFTDATLLGYQVNKNYLGEGLFSINTTKNISIEGVFLNPKTTEGVKESFTKISGLLTGIVDAYDSVIINNYNLGSGKIINISFPEENPIRLGRYRYDIEIVDSGNFNSMPSDSIYGSFLSSGYQIANPIDNIVIDLKMISLEENLNFENQENGDYSYNHDLNIQYYDDKSDIIAKAKNFANGVFNDSLEVGFIGQFSGFYNTLKNKKNYFSESYDLINKRCNFSKRILINSNYNTNYTTNLSHSLSFDSNGKVTVTENGSIKALDNTLAYTADNYFNAEVVNSYSRCQNIFNVYTEKYNLGQKDSLFNQPFSLGKTSDIFTNSLEYNVSYVNDPSFEGNIINTYNITINQDSQGIINYSEQGNLTQIGQIGSVTGLNLIKPKYLIAKSRNNTNYPSLKLKNSSLSLSNLTGAGINTYNNNFSYSIEKTSDNSIIENNLYYKSLSFEISDAAPYDLYKEYIIANKNPKNVLFLPGNQVEIGNRSVTIKGVLVRPTFNPWTTPVTLPLNDLKSKSISGAFDLVSDDAYINNIAYNYDSDNNFSFSLDLKYLRKVEN
jgi:hypothetical protein